MTTNYKQIKNMTIEEMADYLSNNNKFHQAQGIGLRAYLENARNGKIINLEEQNKIQINGMIDFLNEIENLK